MSGFNKLMVPKGLMYRNPGLKGKLKATFMKTLNGQTREGRSMNKWRVIWLQGDNGFLESLYEYPAEHRFQLGSSYVLIKGGNRRELTEKEIDEKEKRKERAINRRQVSYCRMLRIRWKGATTSQSAIPHLGGKVLLSKQKKERDHLS